MATESKKQNPQIVQIPAETASFQTRPFASSGWWLGYLLAIAYSVSYWKHARSSSLEYKLSTIVAAGLAFETTTIFIGMRTKTKLSKLFLYIAAPILTSFFMLYCLHQGIIFSVFSGFVSTFTYRSLYFLVLRKLPQSFTYGEASIIVQGVIIFAYNLFLKLAVMFNDKLKCSTESDSCPAADSSYQSLWISSNIKQMSMMAKLSTVLQIGLFGISILVASCYLVKFLRGKAFYLLLIIVTGAVILFPIENQMAITVIVEFLTKDLQKLCMIVLYTGLIGITISIVAWQLNRHEQSNTRTRKIFHFLIVFVYFPSLVYQCSFLFLASGIALALFILMETIRIIKLTPFHSILDQSIKTFIDEKDAGLIALTPIYLLIGCSLPLWIHPCPCDLTDSAGFEILPLLAGVISVGFGDTAASIVGSKFGNIPWPYCIKTVEGTMASIIAQAIVLPFLIYFGLARYSFELLVKFSLAIITSSLVETFTNQVDNLVLPIISYILLSI